MIGFIRNCAAIGGLYLAVYFEPYTGSTFIRYHAILDYALQRFPSHGTSQVNLQSHDADPS